ncbi:MAG: hypothetical protein V2A58_14575 [Planctomycetota bacterium]
MDGFAKMTLVVAAIGICAFAFVLVHAIRWLAGKGGEGATGFLSRGHAWRRLASASLVIFALAWLALGTTFLAGRIFSAQHPMLALVFLAVLGLVVIAVLALAGLDFREAGAAYRKEMSKKRAKQVEEIVRAALEERGKEHDGNGNP